MPRRPSHRASFQHARNAPPTPTPAFLKYATAGPPSPPPPALALSSAPLAALHASFPARTQVLAGLRQTLLIADQRQAAHRAALHGGGGGGGGDDDAAGAAVQRGEDCPICLDALNAPGACLARCGHMFHMHCIAQNIERRPKAGCPICRRCVHQAELVAVMSGIPQGAEKSKSDETGGEEEADWEGRGGARATIRAGQDAEEVLDLVGAEERTEEGPEKGPEEGPEEGGDGGEKASARLLAAATKRALRAVECELAREDELVEALRAADAERERLNMVWLAERERLRRQAAEKSAATQDMTRRADEMLRHNRAKAEELQEESREMKDNLAKLRKLRSDLELRENEIEVVKDELARKADDMRRAKETVKQDEVRLRALFKRVEERKGREDELRKENNDLRAQLAAADACVVGPHATSTGRGKRKREEREREKESSAISSLSFGEGQQKAKQSLFSGSKLQAPSAFNRPPAPRRGGAGLTSFVVKRSRPQKPVSGVAGGSVAKRWSR